MRHTTNYEPAEVPSYQLVDAARYLHLPYETLHNWTVGGRFAPVIQIAKTEPPILSFMDLVECWVLASLRHKEGISLRRVRNAIHALRQRYHAVHPLAEKEFETDGVDLFIREALAIVNLSKGAQLAIKSVVEAHLRRIERDEVGLVRRLFPFTRRDYLKSKLDVPKVVMIDPLISFGRPVLKGSGICTSVLASRYRGGDSIPSLAHEYGREESEITEAIKWEKAATAA